MGNARPATTAAAQTPRGHASIPCSAYSDGPPMPPPYGNEPRDYNRHTYEYPPCCGQMLGSGN